MRRTFRFLTFFALVLGIAFGIIVIIHLNDHFTVTPKGGVPDMELTGDIGDFVGGVLGTIFSFVATVFVALTLMEQRYQNKRDIFVKNYYEMLHVHSEHVAQMSMKKSATESFSGRDLFPQLVKNYDNIYDCIERYTQNIINGGLFMDPDEGEMKLFLSDNKKRQALIMRLAFGYFFYGTDHYVLPDEEESVEKKIESKIKDIGNKNQFYTRGYHVVLGHYYRHMFQMISYIIDTKCLKENERYTYAKQLRAQLDDNEQLLLYYDAMADFGKAWVIPPEYGCLNIEWWKRKLGVKSEKQMCPMARFRMIRNIPASVAVKGIEPADMFSKEIDFYKENRKKDPDFFEQKRERSNK